MKTLLCLAILAVSAAPLQASSPSLESARTGVEKLFLSVHAQAMGLFEAAPPGQQEPVLRDATLKRVSGEAAGALIGRVGLASQLDRHRDLLSRQLGSLVWDISAAGDPGFKNYYATFAREDQLVIAYLGEIKRLIKEGITVTVVPGVVYHFKVYANIFNPVRGSTLKITPVQGTQGPTHKVKTGVILDKAKEKSYVFRAGGKELWLLYGTDVDPETETLGKTRSFLFIHENGMSSKMWPVAESELELDQPTSVGLDGTTIILTRTSQGELLIHEPGKGR